MPWDWSSWRRITNPSGARFAIASGVPAISANETSGCTSITRAPAERTHSSTSTSRGLSAWACLEIALLVRCRLTAHAVA